MLLPDLYFAPYYYVGRNPLEFLSPFQYTGTALLPKGVHIRPLYLDKGFVKDRYFYGFPTRTTQEWFIDIRQVYLVTNDSLERSDRATDGVTDKITSLIAVPVERNFRSLLQAILIGFLVDPTLLIPYYED